MINKNPFRPINNKRIDDGPQEEFGGSFSDERSKTEKVKVEEVYPDGLPSQEVSNQKIEETKKLFDERTPFKVVLKDKDISVDQKSWSTLIASLYLENCNAGLSLLDITEEFKKTLASMGIDANIDDAHKYMSNTQEKLMKVSTAKAMCYSLGLANEWPEIMKRELEVIYKPKTESQSEG